MNAFCEFKEVMESPETFPKLLQYFSHVLVTCTATGTQDVCRPLPLTARSVSLRTWLIFGFYRPYSLSSVSVAFITMLHRLSQYGFQGHGRKDSLGNGWLCPLFHGTPRERRFHCLSDSDAMSYSLQDHCKPLERLLFLFVS